MQKHKNNDKQNNNQLLIIGLGLLLILGAGGILGTVIEFVVGLVVGIIGLVIGLIGAVIGIVFGLIGAVLGIVGGIIGLVFGTAIIWVPLLIIAMATKGMSNQEPSEKKKHTIV
jgi:hypothetical protein